MNYYYVNKSQTKSVFFFRLRFFVVLLSPQVFFELSSLVFHRCYFRSLHLHGGVQALSVLQGCPECRIGSEGPVGGVRYRRKIS